MPHPPLPFIIITLLLLSLLLLLLLVITVIITSTELLALCDGCLGWGWVWRAGLVAGLRVGQAFGVLLLPGFWVSSSSPQVPGHPTSICDAGVNSVLGRKKLSLIMWMQMQMLANYADLYHCILHVSDAHLKWYYNQKIISFFSSDFESVFAKHPTGKISSFVFYPKAVYFECKFWISRSAITPVQN